MTKRKVKAWFVLKKKKQETNPKLVIGKQANWKN
jgi:hypothetical protein